MTTAHGKQAIGKLHVGEKALSYNPKTHKMELEPILHVWIHTDSDLVDLTITTNTHAPHSTKVTKTQEVLHTNQKHPFFTLEKGFVPVGQLKLGMHVLRADGQFGVITGWKIVPGSKVMYNLEVAQDHTFVVGQGQWVVHNDCDRQALRLSLGLRDGDPYQGHHLIPCELDSHPLAILARLGGFDINGAENGVKLFNGDHKQDALNANQPYHNGSHANYTQMVQDLMDQELETLQSDGSLNSFSGYAGAAQSLRELAAYLRVYLSTGCGAGDRLD